MNRKIIPYNPHLKELAGSLEIKAQRPRLFFGKS